jgi:predicted CopG family antitoxin
MLYITGDTRMRKTPRVNWTISPDVIQMLKEMKTESGLSISDLVEEAVADKYNREKREKKK